MKTATPEQVSRILGKPSVWTNANGTTYEWPIPGTTVEKLSADLRGKLKSLGCTMFNVDTSAEPYYLVSVRYTERPDTGN